MPVESSRRLSALRQDVSYFHLLLPLVTSRLAFQMNRLADSWLAASKNHALVAHAPRVDGPGQDCLIAAWQGGALFVRSLGCSLTASVDDWQCFVRARYSKDHSQSLMADWLGAGCWVLGSVSKLSGRHGNPRSRYRMRGAVHRLVQSCWQDSTRCSRPAWQYPRRIESVVQEESNEVRYGIAWQWFCFPTMPRRSHTTI